MLLPWIAVNQRRGAVRRPPVDMAHLRYGPDDMAHGAVYMAQPVSRYGPAINYGPGQGQKRYMDNDLHMHTHI